MARLVRPFPQAARPTRSLTALIVKPLDTSTTIYVVAGIVLVGFIILAMLKGIIKMLLFGAGVLGGVAAYYWMSKHGFSYLAFLTNDPKSWMITGLAWGSAIAVFAVFVHGMFWFSNVFSWGAKMGFGGIKGLLTTVLMVAVILWISLIAVFYYGSVADVKRAHDIALSQIDGKHTVSTPWMYSWSNRIQNGDSTKWLVKMAPLQDPERISLAKLVAYLATFDPQTAVQRYSALSPHMPRPRRLWVLSQDIAIKTLVKRDDMTTLLNHPELTKFLGDPSSRDAVKRFPVDQFMAQTVRPSVPQTEIPVAEPVL